MNHRSPQLMPISGDQSPPITAIATNQSPPITANHHQSPTITTD